MINDFLSEGCSCSLGSGGSNCSNSFSREDISRMNCKEMSNTELDMLVLANLDAHRCSVNDSGASKNAGQSLGEKAGTKRRANIDYYFHGKRVCKHTYTFVHAVGPKRFKNLVAHFDRHGLVPRFHGNTNRLPANTIPFDKTQSIIRFIEHFATIHALPLPGRLPGQYSDEKALLLPSHMSKRYVYRQYRLACNKKGEVHVGRRKFEDLWSELLPGIAGMKPATDLCHICQLNIVNIMRSANLPDELKSENVREAEKHLALAAQERKMYTEDCLKAAEELKLKPNSPKVVHCSFDFAQQIFYPSSPQQVGPLYFLTPRKCQLFGVCSEAKGEQVHYLIDENDNPGKGANCVVSMLHHYLESKTSVGQHLLLHADNAVGQNKNNTVIQYMEGNDWMQSYNQALLHDFRAYEICTGPIFWTIAELILCKYE